MPEFSQIFAPYIIPYTYGFSSIEMEIYMMRGTFRDGWENLLVIRLRLKKYSSTLELAISWWGGELVLCERERFLWKEEGKAQNFPHKKLCKKVKTFHHSHHMLRYSCHILCAISRWLDKAHGTRCIRSGSFKYERGSVKILFYIHYAQCTAGLQVFTHPLELLKEFTMYTSMSS